MRIEVDQSGKIEQTKTPTVLAFSNGKCRAIYIPAVDKRRLIKYLRERGRLGEWFYPRIFAAMLFLLVKPVLSKTSQIVIDEEYTGHNATISLMLRQFSRGGISPAMLEFAFVGKKSPAHKLAINVYRGKRKPDKSLSLKDILRVIGE